MFSCANQVLSVSVIVRPGPVLDHLARLEFFEVAAEGVRLPAHGGEGLGNVVGEDTARGMALV